LRRLASVSLAIVALLAVAGPTGVRAQISGIERGGGVDRPYVPPRKRIAVKIGKPTSKPTKPGPKGTPTTDVATLRISPEAAKAYEDGRNAYDKGNLDVAIKELEKAVRLESKYVDALIDLGDAYYDKVDLDDAVDAYQRALVIDKNNTDAQFRLGRASFARRDYDTALQQYNAVLKVRPDDPEAIYNIALTYKSLKRYDDAIPYFEKAIAARNKPFPEARVNLARCYYEQDKIDESEAAARKALEEIGPTNQASATAWYALATAQTKKQDLRGATESLEQSIKVCMECPGDVLSRYFLAIAQVYEARGLRGQAADAYEKYLQLAPFIPDYQAQDIRERVSKLRKPA
jgi:tetratricopeptide (TPR) repeat protein